MGKPIDDGGRAFPQPETERGNTVHAEYGEGGMSLRDWFAGQSLIGMISNPAAQEVIHAAQTRATMGEEIAMLAYQYADAMLTERSKQ